MKGSQPSRGEIRWLVGAVAQQVILAEAYNGVDHRLAVGGDAVDHGVGEPQ
jgi:hypothetical protein